jgi:hypothetical protein
MNNELRLCLELLSKHPDRDKINCLSRFLNQDKFLFISAEFPIEEQLKTSKRYGPKELSAILNKQFFIYTVKKKLLYNNIIKIIKRFNKEKIDFIILKSFAYHRLIKIRRISDIDLLIKAESLNDCLRVLRKMGFVKNVIKSEYYFRNFSNEILMNSKSRPQIKVEPHWSITQKFSPVAVNHNALWHDSKIKYFEGQKARVLSNEHNIIHLSIHALYQPALSTPFRDIYVISKIISNKRINWESLANDALQWNANNFLYYSLILAKKYFGSTIPESTLIKLKKRNLQYFLLKMLLFKKLNFLRTTRYDAADLLFELILANNKNRVKILKRAFFTLFIR